MLASGLLGISSEDVTDNLSDDEVTTLPPTLNTFPTPTLNNLIENTKVNNIEEEIFKVIKTN